MKEEILLEDLVLPEGIELTLEDISSAGVSEQISIDKNNVILTGVISYLLAIKKGDTYVAVIRTNRLQKIKIGLDSAA